MIYPNLARASFFNYSIDRLRGMPVSPAEILIGRESRLKHTPHG
jgi:hypothetical protein